VQGSAAIRGAKPYNFGIGVDQFGGARNVTIGGGLPDVGLIREAIRLSGVCHLRLDCAGSGQGTQKEISPRLMHASILLGLRASGKTARVNFVLARKQSISLRLHGRIIAGRPPD
jgi:hypothetical protein